MERLKSGAEKLGIHLTPQQIEQFETYYRELIDWNKRINLTRITDYEEVQLKHFLDSLTVANVCNLNNQNVIDIGTGAGLPGIALKIAFPDFTLALLEATIKKTKFLEYIIDKLGLNDISIIADRAETAAHNVKYREIFDVVISRAVASLPALVELTLPFCKIGGTCIYLKKGDIEEEVKQANKAIDVIGGKLKAVKEVEIEDLPDNRWLVIIEKIKPTAAQYPRRPGIPEKSPIIS
jgi:16S rRNA (guanine527-N7)-methyltransferase